MNINSPGQNHKPGPCRLYNQGHCRFGAKCRFGHDVLVQNSNPTLPDQPSTSTIGSADGSSDARPRPKRGELPCRAWKAGTCTRGSKCWFSHDVEKQEPERPRTTHQEVDRESSSPISSQMEAGPPSALRTRKPSEQAQLGQDPRSEDRTCRYWKSGTCRRGDNCQFSHGHESRARLEAERAAAERARERAQAQERVAAVAAELARERAQAQERDAAVAAERARERAQVQERVAAVAAELAHERAQAQERAAAIAAERARERAQAQERAAAAAAERAREHAREIAKEEAAKTITQVVLGSIVTYSAGLNIPSLIAGFETCTLHVKNLPFGVSEGEVRGLFVSHGMDIERFHVIDIKKASDGKLEARIISDTEAGRALASRLDGFEFRDDTLSVDVSASNTLEGMSAAVTRDTDVLTISWRCPSVRYVAEYVDIEAAQEKVPELNNKMYVGRRVKVEMNTQPPGRFLPNFNLDAIKISNLSPSVTDEEVMAFTGSSSVKRLGARGFVGLIGNAEQVARRVRDDIEEAVPTGLRQFDPPGTPDANGVVFVRAHFSSWDDAHVAYTTLEGRRYGNPQPVWLRLPDPMHFTIIIPSEQYRAQRAQWGALISSIKDRKACMLNVHDIGNIVRIRLAGSAKEAMGAMKVRVENLARGEMVEGWHRSLGFSNNPFLRRVFVEAEAYVRADWRRQSLKVYGAARAVDQARDMIKTELERLASLDYTVTLKRHSIGFFVREGIPQLKETLGENNVRFAASSGKITVTGGEEARHALDGLITLSLKGDRALLNTSQGEQTCPICYDNVTSPQQLGCGHVYCVACLRHFLSSALDSDQLPLTCLGDEARCRVPIPIPTIQQFLPPASFNRLLEAAFDSHVSKHPEEFKCCKTPDCTQLYRSVRPGDRAKSLHCPSCFASVCNACNEDAHEGLTCAESKIRKDPAEQDRLNDEWIASQGGRVKKCPRCSVPIEKTEGCNHMTCHCGAHICWRCMNVFTAETIYPHMHSAHGTMHDDIPPDPQVFLVNDPILRAVDIEQQRELLRQAELRRVAAIRDQNTLNAARRLREMNEEEARVRERERLRQVEQERIRLERARLLYEEPGRQRREEILRDYQMHQRLAQARQLEETQRREQARREQEWQERQQREERRRREQQDGGWGCTIM